VTGFAKRKQQRREAGAIQLAKKQRIARNAARKEVNTNNTHKHNKHAQLTTTNKTCQIN